MELERLRDSSEKSGVRELWRGEVSLEVKEAWQKAQAVLGEAKEEELLDGR